MDVKIVNDFREKKICNNWIDDFDEYCKKLWDNFSFKLTDDESLIEVQKRNIKELKNTIRENKGKTIIIGTHGIALSTIINYYDSTFLYDDFMEIVNIMPYIIKIEFNGNKYLGREEIKLY
jgi:2,3-bisphosphoglycerate-dependent phosphoglycerate mutase